MMDTDIIMDRARGCSDMIRRAAGVTLCQKEYRGKAFWGWRIIYEDPGLVNSNVLDLEKERESARESCLQRLLRTTICIAVGYKALCVLLSLVLQ